MVDIFSTLLENLAWGDSFTLTSDKSLLEVHLVDQHDHYYHRGRALACLVYKEVWGTENLIDSNDYGVIVLFGGKVVGNANIQVRTEHQILKSEKFFTVEHWQPYASIPYYQVAELSALSLISKLSPEIKQLVMMLLIFGTYVLGRSIGKTFCVTIQRKALYRIISKHLHIPFYKNELVRDIQWDIPKDRYWQGKELPRLYYLNLIAPETIESIDACFVYLNSLGFKTKFYPRFQEPLPGYAKFRKHIKGLLL